MSALKSTAPVELLCWHDSVNSKC